MEVFGNGGAVYSFGVVYLSRCIGIFLSTIYQTNHLKPPPMLPFQPHITSEKVHPSQLDLSSLPHSYRGSVYFSSSSITFTQSNDLEGRLINGISQNKPQSVLSKRKRAGSLKFNRKDGTGRGTGRRVRKNLVLNRCDAFSRLDQSKKFLAFFTISFPAGVSDEFGYKCLNIWLTRIRKWRANFSYLWVAERQRNGTIHFHLLTNMFLQIRIVNKMMAASIRGELKRLGNEAINFNYSKYNGVDVSRVKSPKAVARYVSKYMVKEFGSLGEGGGAVKFEPLRQVWHCSRSVARLFVSQVLHMADGIDILQRYLHTLKKLDLQAFVVHSPYFFFIRFVQPPPSRYLSELYQFNS